MNPRSSHVHPLLALIRRAWPPPMTLLWMIGICGSLLHPLAQSPIKPTVCFIIGENEYRTWETLPAFATRELIPSGLNCVFVQAPPGGGNTFTNLDAISNADLVVLSVRRRTPDTAFMTAFRAHLAAGKPLVGIRTASHAFGATPPDSDHHAWETFDRDILGAQYGNHLGKGPNTIIIPVPEALTHPILQGIPTSGWESTSHLYLYKKTASTLTPLLYGRQATSTTNAQLLAWTSTADNRRVFYTALGAPDDFANPAFRTLLANGIFWALNRPNPHAVERQTTTSTASKALTPEVAAGTFTTPPDLEFVQVLSEPIVAQPVFLNFDTRGRLWVVQYRQYPNPAGLKMLSRDNVWRAVYDKVPAAPPNHVRGLDRITIHESTRHDGQFDKHTTFIDGLNIVTAVEHAQDGVWVLNPPYLLFYPDRNQDDVPDGDPEVHLAGFGLEDTHSVVNSLRWGPDGWLYGAQGSTVTASITRPGIDSALITKTMGQQIWRYHPPTRRFETFAEGGGNAFGVEIDPQGRIFSGHNGGNTRGFHYAPGAYLQKGFEKHGPLSNPYAFGFFPPMTHPDAERFTHSFILYDGGSLPPSYNGKLFGIEPLQGRIVLSEITRTASTFQTRDILHAVTSTDPWFKPVDIKVGPDGAIYVCDWYDRQVNHYRNHEGQIDPSTGRIYRLQIRGARPIQAFNLQSVPSPALPALTAHTNKWFRQQAQRILRERHDPKLVPVLKGLLLDQPRSGGNALDLLWALDASGGLDEATALKTLRHPDPQVRLWTARLRSEDPNPSSSIARAITDQARLEPDIEARVQFAASARRLPASDALPIVAALLTHPEDASDPRQPLTLWWTIESKLTSESSPTLEFLLDPAHWANPIMEQHLLERIMRRLAATGSRADLLLCARFLDAATTPASTLALLNGFDQAYKGRSRTGLPGALTTALTRAALRSPSSAIPSWVFQARQGQPAAISQALAAASDPATPDADRIAALEIIQDLHPTGGDSAAMSALAGTTNLTLQIRAIQALRLYTSPTLPGLLIPKLQTLPLEAQTHALAILSARPAYATALLQAVANGTVPAKGIPGEIRSQIRRHHDPELASLANTVFGPDAQPASPELQASIERVRNMVSTGTGNPYDGQKIFQTTCANCHRLFGMGGQVGPDLTPYKRDDLDTLLLNIINPSAEIREGYESVTVETKDDRSLTGFLTDQDPAMVVIRTLDGENNVVPKAQILSLQRSKTSLMPVGLLDGLSPQDIRHLFAYLRSSQPLVR